MAYKNRTELIQYVTTIVSIICAIASTVAYHAHPKWRKHNYLYFKQIIVKCAATCCMVFIIILPEDLASRDMLVIAYFTIVLATVLGTLHTIALGHLHVALSCEEIPDEETLVEHSWYSMIATTGIVFYCVKSVLSLELLTVDCLIGILLLGISTGNVLLLSRVFKLVGKCTITFMLCVNTLAILCDVFLVLYGGLLVNGDNVGFFNDVVKVACTGTMVLKTVLILCSKDAMDWTKFKCSSAEIIEM